MAGPDPTQGLSGPAKTFDSRADAEAWARSIENEMDRGVFVSRSEAENTTLAEALDRYEREVSSLKKVLPSSVFIFSNGGNILWGAVFLRHSDPLILPPGEMKD